MQGTFSCVIIQTMETIKKNKEYIVTIEAYNSESSGVARIDGRAVFIPNALKGEVWHIKVLKARFDQPNTAGNQMVVEKISDNVGDFLNRCIQ